MFHVRLPRKFSKTRKLSSLKMYEVSIVSLICAATLVSTSIAKPINIREDPILKFKKFNVTIGDEIENSDFTQDISLVENNIDDFVVVNNKNETTVENSLNLKHESESYFRNKRNVETEPKHIQEKTKLTKVTKEAKAESESESEPEYESDTDSEFEDEITKNVKKYLTTIINYAGVVLIFIYSICTFVLFVKMYKVLKSLVYL
ncbi:hypothetical protein CsNV_050 [Callinectes sapidus nudivirus]|nr:hypothetical protein CsNV_050 [Callinectes sapidus nudivirus]